MQLSRSKKISVALFTALTPMMFAFQNCSPTGLSTNASTSQPTSQSGSIDNGQSSGDSGTSGGTTAPSGGTSGSTPTTPVVVTPPPTPSGVPSYTTRANKRYISVNGNDSANGLTPQTAWRRMDQHIGSIPSDTEIIYLAGQYYFGANQVYSSYGGRPALPARITLRAETFQNVSLIGETGGNAFNIDDYADDFEIWGFQLTGWKDQWGNGVITVSGNVNGLKIIGNKFYGNGSGNEVQDHDIYLSGGDTFATAPRNIQIRNNEANETGNNGAFIHSYGHAYAAHDWVATGNIVRGQFFWGIIIDPKFAGPAQININQNDFRINASYGVVNFWYGDGTAGRDGVDGSCVLENNIFVNSATGYRAGAIRVDQVVTGGTQHRPTLRNNTYYNSSGGPVLININVGSGDQIKAP